MTRDYSVPVLQGTGDTDYARYMRTDELLSLQRRADQVVHRDELLFQTVHQSTELWLKHACFEADEAAAQIRVGAPDAAVRLLGRACLGVELVTRQLEMLTHLSPWTFQQIRTALGHGSGFESPGWRSVQRCGVRLREAFEATVLAEGVDLLELYQGSPDAPTYRLAEALVAWDDHVAAWRARHFKIVTRIIGHDAVGTKGTPVDALARLLSHKFFPQLWQVRSELTRSGPLGDACPLAVPSPDACS